MQLAPFYKANADSKEYTSISAPMDFRRKQSILKMVQKLYIQWKHYLEIKKR